MVNQKYLWKSSDLQQYYEAGHAILMKQIHIWNINVHEHTQSNNKKQ